MLPSWWSRRSTEPLTVVLWGPPWCRRSTELLVEVKSIPPSSRRSTGGLILDETWRRTTLLRRFKPGTELVEVSSDDSLLLPSSPSDVSLLWWCLCGGNSPGPPPFSLPGPPRKPPGPPPFPPSPFCLQIKLSAIFLKCFVH